MNYTLLSSLFNERFLIFYIFRNDPPALEYLSLTQMRFNSKISLSVSGVVSVFRFSFFPSSFLPSVFPLRRLRTAESLRNLRALHFRLFEKFGSICTGWRRSNGGASSKMLFERQSGLAARPAGCYIIHIYTFTQGDRRPRVRFTPVTCLRRPA